ncbi:hypothetical protein BQ8794_240242 [Mesorhizobium prunaredense]|uniref:Uncharacterized protein n=1 Tax=Mesorhizobium prunaredense TaxID=1631249 RepID=A0A1R3V813_9HYPH|nr:hypothetical protein BQ8794_240242 [Mesorhizobium prunaredense]
MTDDLVHSRSNLKAGLIDAGRFPHVSLSGIAHPTGRLLDFRDRAKRADIIIRQRD